jgi:1-acyl-sn-glycerol-3-phosphate acyltransferase
MFYAVLRVLAWPIAHVLFWPKLTGRENLPDHGPVIIASNHLGVGETFLLPIMVRPHITFPAKKELFRTDTWLHRLGAWFMRAIGQVPIDRAGGDSSQDALGSIYEVLEQGGYVAVFPEGHRSPDGRLYKGHTGVARLALMSGAPILPMGCFRTRFVRKGFPIPWMRRPELRFGEVFSFPEQTCLAFRESTDYREGAQILRATTAEIMNRIQQITGQEMVDHYSYVGRR